MRAFNATPAASLFTPELLLKARGAAQNGIRLAIFDVDGVLTDGRLYFTASGEALKAFSTLDGHGLKLLARGGIDVAIISGRDSPALRGRVAELGIVHAFYGVGDKLAVAEALLAKLQVGWEGLAVMGDDWPDLPLLQQAAFSCAPPNAHAEVRARVDHVTAAAGGFGAARECCDLLLTAAGRYAELLRAHQVTLDTPK